MPNRLTIMRCAAILSLLLGSVHSSYAETGPSIARVKLVQKDSGITAKIFGAHFGTSPVKLPCRKCSPTELQFFYFLNTDADRVNPTGTGDRPGAPIEKVTPITIRQWTDSYIELSDLTGAAGATVVFAIKNDSLGNGGKDIAGTFNLPGGTGAPVIRRLKLYRDHRQLKIRVEGKGFGKAPPGIPGSLDMGYFQFWTWVTDGIQSNYPWSAGHVGDAVTLNYDSWTDSRIVISGFGSNYHGGVQDWIVRQGDSVAVTLSKNLGHGSFGASTGIVSRIPW